MRRTWGRMVALGALVLLEVLPVSTVSGASPDSGSRVGDLLGTLPNAEPNAGSFGYATAISGSTAIVSSLSTIVPIGPGGDGAEPGEAFIYSRQDGVWPPTPVATLETSSIQSDFGRAVAISGSTAIVSIGANGFVGAVNVYEKGSSGWSTTPTLTLADPVGSTGDDFGSSVAISGGTLIVGAPQSNGGRGASYIYTQGPEGWRTSPSVTLVDPAATPEAGDEFGESVAASGDSAVVAGNALGLGRAYIYSEGTTGWSSLPAATVSDPTPSARGPCRDVVGLSVRTVLLGDPCGRNGNGRGNVYLYDRSARGWPADPGTTLTDPGNADSGFAGDAAISGSVVVVGAGESNGRAGSAYLYRKDTTGVWPTVPTVTLGDPQATRHDTFGGSVAVSGTTALIAAVEADPTTSSGTGRAYLYGA